MHGAGMLFILVYAHMLKGLFLILLVTLDIFMVVWSDYFFVYVFVAFIDMCYLGSNELLSYYYYA